MLVALGYLAITVVGLGMSWLISQHFYEKGMTAANDQMRKSEQFSVDLSNKMNDASIAYSESKIAESKIDNELEQKKQRRQQLIDIQRSNDPRSYAVRRGI